MPTPIPIMAASEVDQSGTGSSLAMIGMSRLLTARPATAVSSGRPAATTEPKVISRMIAAAAMPMPSEPMAPCSACWTAMPPSEAVTPPPVWPARSSKRWVSVFGMSTGLTTSRRRRPTAVRPSAETDPGRYGSSVLFTCDTPARRFIRSSTAALAPGAARPASACTTTVMVSPDCSGNRCLSRSWATLESEPGAE